MWLHLQNQRQHAALSIIVTDGVLIRVLNTESFSLLASWFLWGFMERFASLCYFVYGLIMFPGVFESFCDFVWALVLQRVRRLLGLLCSLSVPRVSVAVLLPFASGLDVWVFISVLVISCFISVNLCFKFCLISRVSLSLSGWITLVLFNAAYTE